MEQIQVRDDNVVDALVAQYAKKYKIGRNALAAFAADIVATMPAKKVSGKSGRKASDNSKDYAEISAFIADRGEVCVWDVANKFEVSHNVAIARMLEMKKTGVIKITAEKRGPNPIKWAVVSA